MTEEILFTGKEKRSSCSKEYHKMYTEKWRENNHEIYKQSCKRSSAKYHRNIKQNVINFYGGKCECCEENNIEFLTLHHLNGSGTNHRKRLKKSGTPFYKWIIDNNYPKGYGILCQNCNSSLGYYGYCPHKNI